MLKQFTVTTPFNFIYFYNYLIICLLSELLVMYVTHTADYIFIFQRR